MNLADIQAQFPKINAESCAMTGAIPMDFVNDHQDEFRQIVREHQLRRIYRGPRTQTKKNPSNTLKADAVAMVLYSTSSAEA
jgi:tryptophan synthase alpha subunit